MDRNLPISERQAIVLVVYRIRMNRIVCLRSWAVSSDTFRLVYSSS